MIIIFAVTLSDQPMPKTCPAWSSGLLSEFTSARILRNRRVACRVQGLSLSIRFMVQLILLRPGTTDYDIQDRIQGTLDIPLTEPGRQEAEQTAEKLRPFLPAAIYCSPRR